MTQRHMIVAEHEDIPGEPAGGYRLDFIQLGATPEFDNGIGGMNPPDDTFYFKVVRPYSCEEP